MKRRLFTLLLAVWMCCILAACAGPSKNDDQMSEKDSASESDLSADTPAENTTSVDAPPIEPDFEGSDSKETVWVEVGPSETDPEETEPTDSESAETHPAESEPVGTESDTSGGDGWETNHDGSIDLPIVPFAS